jgi:phytoene dehydrogenase-like protein
MIFGNIRDLLNEYLESEEVKAAVAMLGLMSTVAGPSTVGAPYMLLQRPLSLASQSAEAGYDPRTQPLRGSTGLPKGGMGAIPEAMERSLKASGVTIRCNSEVVAILADQAGARGVALSSGEELYARVILSNLNPKITLLRLLDPALLDNDIRERMDALPMRGSVFKIGLALDALPRFAAARNDAEAHEFAKCQFRIGPSMEYMERAYIDATFGRPSAGPMFWGLTPSVTDPDLAPPGKHVMSINIFHAPYKLAQGSWETRTSSLIGGSGAPSTSSRSTECSRGTLHTETCCRGGCSRCAPSPVSGTTRHRSKVSTCADRGYGQGDM